MVTYKIMPGDTMWHIAMKKGINLNDLIMANPQISNPAFIYPGQIINLTNTNQNNNDNNNTNPSNNFDSLENEVIRLVNAERNKAGLSSLTTDSNLTSVARTKSQDFINNNYFSHNSPTYGTPFEMLTTMGIKYSAAAENIASGQKTAAEVMNSWMNSSGHKANILNSNFNKIGVGVAKANNGNLYWTQLFTRS